MRILVVGQGVSGTWLSYWLLHKGATVQVIDAAEPMVASRVASGVINPVTGRQVATTWLADTLLPFAETHYKALGGLLGTALVHNTGILAFPPSEQMLQAYQEKMKASPCYVQVVENTEVFKPLFHFFFDAVRIQPAYHIQLPEMLSGWRNHLHQHNALIQDTFTSKQLQVKDSGVVYQDQWYDKVIYADGPAAFEDHYWNGLPFSLNKGEAIIADIPALPKKQIYKFGITTLVPWQDGKWWLGSTYDNRFTDVLPTPAFRQKMELFLQQTLKVPYQIEAHLAGIRPATIDRRPFVGMHAKHPQVGIFNGMGTKGVSLAPWLARQLAEHLLEGGAIEPLADIARFKRAFL